MSYWFLNKEKDESRIFGSLPVLVKHTEPDYEQWQYRFKYVKTKYEDDRYRVHRLENERSTSE